MTEDPPVSTWATERFGDQASAVHKAIVNALIDTQTYATQAHHSSKTDSNHVYGTARYQGQYKRFADTVGALDGAILIRPRTVSFHLVIINGVLLVPLRYASTLGTPIEEATLPRPVARWAREAFARFGSRASVVRQDSLFPVEVLSSLAKPVRPVLDHVDPETRLVVVPYACNSQAGLLSAWWGEADLMEDGTLRWAGGKPEKLPIHSLDRSTLAENLSSVVPVQRFNEGDEPGLDFPPQPPGTLPTSEQDQQVPEAEGNERP